MIQTQNLMLRTNIIGQVIDITPNPAQRRGYRIKIKDAGYDFNTIENRFKYPIDCYVKDLVGETIFVDPQNALAQGTAGKIIYHDPKNSLAQEFLNLNKLFTCNINDYVSLKINLPVEFTYNYPAYDMVGLNLSNVLLLGDKKLINPPTELLNSPIENHHYSDFVTIGYRRNPLPKNIFNNISMEARTVLETIICIEDVIDYHVDECIDQYMLMEEINMSEKEIDEAINKLEEAGAVQRIKTYLY